MRLLVTGRRGFIGSAIAGRAAAAAWPVLGVDRRPDPDHAGGATLALADVEAALAAFRPDVVVHAAGPASVSASFAAPLDDLDASLTTWATTLEAVRRSGSHPRVVLLSSAAVYGETDARTLAEDAPVAPVSPYGFHKAAAELLGLEYARCFDVDVLVCRCFSTLGPGQRRLIVWELFRRLQGPDSTVWLEGTGAERRDYLHVDDLADAVLGLVGAAARRARTGGHEVVNVASGAPITALDVATALRDLVAPAKRIACRGVARRGDPQRLVADVSRLRARLPGWRPRPFASALADCVAAWRVLSEVAA